MLNKLMQFVRQYQLILPGDRIICAVSGGADSMALLFALYLLSEKLEITIAAAHFNHRLRGAESDRDEAFVRSFCDGYHIPFYSGSGVVVSGAKGLEASARDARYAFLKSLPGKIATAHTANDNAETVLMHMVRGTGLKGLGGITPAAPGLIRPMLLITRSEILAFLQEYHVAYVDDSSNQTDQFLRNRLRHHVMPLLVRENPRLAENMSAMALRLREDEAALTQQKTEMSVDVPTLRQMSAAQRRRALRVFLEHSGVKEPEAEHVALTESLVFSEKPSVKASLPGDITIARNYDRLEVLAKPTSLQAIQLTCPGETVIPQLSLKVICRPVDSSCDMPDCFTVSPSGAIWLRQREAGDIMRLPGGTKSLKKLFIDRKIPAAQRGNVPVIADDKGVLGVYGIGVNHDRLARQMPGIEIRFEII